MAISLLGFLFLLGLETLPLRMARHVENAVAIATFLAAHPAVSGVRYPGLPASPYRELVKRYLPRGAGSIFVFDLVGGREAGQRFIEHLGVKIPQCLALTAVDGNARCFLRTRCEVGFDVGAPRLRQLAVDVGLQLRAGYRNLVHGFTSPA